MGLKINILLVEDDKINQVIVSTFLRKWDMTFAIANNGREAVQVIQNKNFDLVLMDIQMPVMDGLETTTAIRAMDNPYFKAVPIIAFSADFQILKNSTARNGLTDSINKMFDPQELLEKINEHTNLKTTGYREHGKAIIQGLEGSISNSKNILGV